MKLRFLLLAILFIVGAIPFQQALVIQNGDFETGNLNGWTTQSDRRARAIIENHAT